MNRKSLFSKTLEQAKGQKFGNIETGNPVRQMLHHVNVWTVLLISVLLLTASCAGKNTSSEQTDKNELIVKQYFEHFNNHEWQKMADMYIDNAEFKDPSVGTEVFKMSKRAVVTKYSELANMFPDLKNSVIKTYPSGDKNIIVEFVTVGTAPDSSVMVLPICTIFTVENGKITKDLSYYDNFE
jgi:ketosteroid isomerase-like protein